MKRLNIGNGVFFFDGLGDTIDINHETGGYYGCGGYEELTKDEMIELKEMIEAALEYKAIKGLKE